MSLAMILNIELTLQMNIFLAAEKWTKYRFVQFSNSWSCISYLIPRIKILETPSLANERSKCVMHSQNKILLASWTMQNPLKTLIAKETIWIYILTGTDSWTFPWSVPHLVRVLKSIKVVKVLLLLLISWTKLISLFMPGYLISQATFLVTVLSMLPAIFFKTHI